MLEASVLLAVFPVVDQLVTASPFRWVLVAEALGFSLLAMIIGVYLRTRGGSS